MPSSGPARATRGEPATLNSLMESEGYLRREQARILRYDRGGGMVPAAARSQDLAHATTATTPCRVDAS